MPPVDALPPLGWNGRQRFTPAAHVVKGIAGADQDADQQNAHLHDIGVDYRLDSSQSVIDHGHNADDQNSDPEIHSHRDRKDNGDGVDPNPCGQGAADLKDQADEGACSQVEAVFQVFINTDNVIAV